MDISRRVLFGAVAGGIVAARKLHATGRVTKTEREVLVEKLMRPLDGPPESRVLDDVRVGWYRGSLVTFSGWTASLKTRMVEGKWTATRPNSDWTDCAQATFLVAEGGFSLPGYDDTIELMLIERRRALNTLLDRIEANS